MDLPSFIESIKEKLKNFELSEEHTKSLGDELNIIFGSLIDERKRAKLPDELEEILDCLELTPSDEDIFTKMHYITSATDKIAIATLSLTEAFPVTFHVLCLIFQNFGIVFRQSLGTFTYPSSSSNKKQYHSRDLETHAHAVGLENLLKTAHAYLNGVDENASASEIENLQNRVPYEKCAECLGNIKAKIENLLPQTDFESAYLAITYLNIYARLALLRSVVFWQLYCLKKRSKFGQTSAKSIYLMIKTNEDFDLDVIEFITIPIYERAVFLTLFHPSENKQCVNFLKANGMQLPVSLAETELRKDCHYVIRPTAWPHWLIDMGWDVTGSVCGWKKETLASHFQFESVLNRESDNIFYIRSRKWKEYYVYMRNNPWGLCAGVKGTPDTEGQWKILQFEINGQKKYLMSPLKWPCKFIYMTNSLWGQVFGKNIVKKPERHNGLWKIDEC